MRKVVLRGSIRNVVMAQQLIMDLVWEEMETAIGVMQFMIPDEVLVCILFVVDSCRGLCISRNVVGKSRRAGWVVTVLPLFVQRWRLACLWCYFQLLLWLTLL